MRATLGVPRDAAGFRTLGGVTSTPETPETAGAPRAPRSSRRKVGCVVGLTAVVVVLVGGGALAEGVTHSIAEDVAVDAVRNAASATDVDVSIEGFPFLPQLLRGTLDDVRVSAATATLRGLAVTDLDIVATGVEVREPRGAEHVRATATVPTAALEQLLRDRTGWDLSLAVDGDTLVASGEAAGVPASVALTITPAGTDGITATITSASLAGLGIDAGFLPDGLASRITQFGLTDALPAGASVTDATVEADGVHLDVELTDVTLDEL